MNCTKVRIYGKLKECISRLLNRMRNLQQCANVLNVSLRQYFHFIQHGRISLYNPYNYSNNIKVGGTEALCKIILFYLRKKLMQS